MKALIAAAALACSLSVSAEGPRTIFKISDLKGTTTWFTGDDGKPLAEPKTEDDGQSDTIYIQAEDENEGGESYFISHNNGRAPSVMLRGEKSIVFVEAYGDNTFTYTICMDHKHPDGSLLVVCTNTKGKGVLNAVSSSTMSGKAVAVAPLKPEPKQPAKESSK
jgi:hypothetical protein